MADHDDDDDDDGRLFTLDTIFLSFMCVADLLPVSQAV